MQHHKSGHNGHGCSTFRRTMATNFRGIIQLKYDVLPQDFKRFVRKMALIANEVR